MTRALLQQALEFAESVHAGEWTGTIDRDALVSDIRAHLANTKDVEPVAFTTGHCKEKAKVGGCQLHNLHCGYPECDRKPANPTALSSMEPVAWVEIVTNRVSTSFGYTSFQKPVLHIYEGKTIPEGANIYLSPTIPTGMVLAPEVPTEAMKAAGHETFSTLSNDGIERYWDDICGEMFKAMLAAAKKGE